MGRLGIIGLTLASVSLGAFALPAAAAETTGPRVVIDKFAEADSTPVVSLGEMIGIACEALEYSAPENDVRVVLTISAAPSDAVGFRKVLATEEQLSHGAVRVRIPEVPDLANHTVNVDVYVVGANGSHNCTAGQMHIAESKRPGSGHRKAS